MPPNFNESSRVYKISMFRILDCWLKIRSVLFCFFFVLFLCFVSKTKNKSKDLLIENSLNYFGNFDFVINATMRRQWDSNPILLFYFLFFFFFWEAKMHIKVDLLFSSCFGCFPIEMSICHAWLTFKKGVIQLKPHEHEHGSKSKKGVLNRSCFPQLIEFTDKVQVNSLNCHAVTNNRQTAVRLSVLWYEPDPTWIWTHVCVAILKNTPEKQFYCIPSTEFEFGGR